MRLWVLTEVLLKNTAFLDVTLRLQVNSCRRFGRIIFFFHLYNEAVQEETSLTHLFLLQL
jgi:hypothetical protein